MNFKNIKDWWSLLYFLGKNLLKQLFVKHDIKEVVETYYFIKLHLSHKSKRIN